MVTISFRIIYRISLLTCFLNFLLIGLNAQNCGKAKAYKQCAYPDDSRFENKLNWSKTFRKGQTKQYVLTFFKNRHYYISVCSKKYNDNIHFKIKEDNEDQDVLYDNALYELNGVMEFHMKETKKLIIEIYSPPSRINEVTQRYICVGMRLFYRKGK
jgi:hypothetical protein